MMDWKVGWSFGRESASAIVFASPLMWAVSNLEGWVELKWRVSDDRRYARLVRGIAREREVCRIQLSADVLSADTRKT